MEKYFDLNYEFDRSEVQRKIDETLVAGGHGYIPVADGVVLSTAHRNPEYLKVLQGSMFCICDSSWVPLYVKSIYGLKKEQYCGSQIFDDLVCSRKYRMAFLGTNTETLEAMRARLLAEKNPDVADMLFYELPFCDVDEFNYDGIARMLEADGADIIWVALGAPKQEQFMARLNEHLSRGIQIAVGAVFKFQSGIDEKVCRNWVRKNHMEFIYRIIQDPKKQTRRCFWILATLPKIYFAELRRKKHACHFAAKLESALTEYMSALKSGNRKASDAATHKVLKYLYGLKPEDIALLSPGTVSHIFTLLSQALDITCELNLWDNHMKTVLKRGLEDYRSGLL